MPGTFQYHKDSPSPIPAVSAKTNLPQVQINCYNDNMKSITARLILTIILISLSVSLIIGAATLYRSSSLLEDETRTQLLASTKEQPNGLSSKFSHIEGLVDSLTGTVTAAFDAKKGRSNPQYVKSFNRDLKRIIKNSLSATQLAHGLYVTYNPEFTSRNDEVWYARMDGQITYIAADFAANKRNFSLPYDEDMAYFFKPQETGSPSWTGPYYDRDVSLSVLSYSRAICINGQFVGVAGADITTDTTLDLVSSMKLYPRGYAFLLDEKGNPIIAPKNPKAQSLIKAGQASVSEFTAGEKMMVAYAPLSNGWMLATVQPQSEAYHAIDQLKNAFLIIFIITLTVIIILAVFFSRAFSKPIEEKQLLLEKENYEKDVLLVYQARQAKIGEMMGNITHQWKQPLNSIHLIIENLLDAYNYDALDKETMTAAADKIETITKTMARTITDFTQFLKPPAKNCSFELNKCIALALSLMEESLRRNNITVDFDAKQTYYAYGNANECSHVLFNILNNARDAILESGPEDRRIRISIHTCMHQGAHHTQLEIFNAGDPIPDEQLAKLFDQYYTTKSSDQGTGLGLYISRIIIEKRMNGTIRLINGGGGVSCIIEIPTEGGK